MKKAKQRYQHTCKRCEWIWMSKLERPILCPGCKSPYWAKERVMLRYILLHEKAEAAAATAGTSADEDDKEKTDA